MASRRKCLSHLSGRVDEKIGWNERFSDNSDVVSYIKSILEFYVRKFDGGRNIFFASS